MSTNNGSSGNDAPTPIISNRKAAGPRFSSLDGPVLRVEYYQEPFISSEAVLSTKYEISGAAIQLGLQLSRMIWKRALSLIAFSLRRHKDCARPTIGRGGGRRPPVAGISNFGQTCFANAIFQALAASDSMYEYLEQVRGRSLTADQLYAVLKELRLGETEVDPRPLLKKFYSTMHEQNDAQEFLQRLIDSIVEQVDWDAYQCDVAKSMDNGTNQQIVGAMESMGNIDDSWSPITSCQLVLERRASKESMAESTSSKTTELSRMLNEEGTRSADKFVTSNRMIPFDRFGNETESKLSDEDRVVNDDLHKNFSKDTVISAETVWIHSYSLSSEEKREDSVNLHTGLDVLKKESFHVHVDVTKKVKWKPQYSALSPSPLHGWMGTILSCDKCKSRNRPIPNDLCCTIPVIPKYANVVDCVRSVFAPEHIEHVQCDYCPRDPALELERQDWINAIRHTSGDTSAMEAELERVEEALKTPLYSDATKASVLMRLPIVLSLHIQRRQLDGQKNTQHVEFEESFTINGSRYRLISVIEHLGGPNSGHYVCYRPKWWRISDRQIQLIDWDRVRRAQAYMLFYEQVAAGDIALSRETTVPYCEISHTEANQPSR